MIVFVLLRRWWSWACLQFHRAQSLYCSKFPITMIMEVPADAKADARAIAGHPEGAERDLRLMAARAGRSRIKAYACGGCRYGHD